MFRFTIFCLFVSIACASTQPEVENHEANSTIRYPVVLLRGSVDPAATEISSAVGNRKIPGAVHEGRFKVLAELKPGPNTIKIAANADAGSTEFELTYEPQSNPYYVRVIWLTDREGDTTYASATDDDPQNYTAKLDTAAKLMQTFTAERMQDSGFGRVTFRLDLNEQGRVRVHTLNAPKLAKDYFAMKDGPWFQETIRWLNQNHPDPYAKNIVLAAFTRKDPATGKMLAHTALGGGNMGLFGSASVFSWPNSLEEVTTAFLNSNKFDVSRVHNDSVGRDNFWGTASTTIGATLHEMGHTFGLPHCQDPFGIMTRGHDHFHRAFVLNDAPGGQRIRPYDFPENEIAYFAPISASFLRWTRWFQTDKPEYSDDARPTAEFDAEKDQFVVRSPHGIRWVGFWQENNVSKFREFPDEAPQQLLIPRSEWEELMGDAKLNRISVLAGNGMDSRCDLPKSD
ncbi:MAG: hypothetical protein ACI8UO_003178 [Verrucomicrobiales bacterium]|jgi:hypothetical protein